VRYHSFMPIARFHSGVGAKPAVTAPRWFVYIARCADGSLYTGVARDVALRIAAHNRGRGARYTRGRGPLTVCATRRCPTHGDALRLELHVKRLPRSAKEALLTGRRLATFARRLSAEEAP
jgi:predicted GIY-YIG superfamily endonuclease